MKHMYTEPHFMLSAAWLFQQPHLCWLFERLGCRLGSMLLLTQSCTFLVPYYVCQCWGASRRHVGGSAAQQCPGLPQQQALDESNSRHNATASCNHELMRLPSLYKLFFLFAVFGLVGVPVCVCIHFPS